MSHGLSVTRRDLFEKLRRRGTTLADPVGYDAGYNQGLREGIDAALVFQSPGALEAFDRVSLLAEWIERDRREPDKVLTYAQELARLKNRIIGPTYIKGP